MKRRWNRKRIWSATLAAAVALLGAMPPAGAAAREALLHNGTEVRVRLLEPLSSQTAEEGMVLALETVDEIQVGGVVVMERGAVAEGRIARVNSRHGFGRRGQLALSVDRAEAVDGSSVPLENESSFRGRERYSKAAVVTLLFGPFGIFVKGNDVELPAGTVLSAYVRGDRRVRVDGSVR